MKNSFHLKPDLTKTVSNREFGGPPQVVRLVLTLWFGKLQECIQLDDFHMIGV